MVRTTEPIPNTQPSAVKTPETVRVAIATKGGGLVNQHFGHAREFFIYEVNGEQATLREIREVSPYCHGPEDAPGDLNTIIRTLSDCEALLVAKIGIGPDDRLREAGIEPVQVYDVIETAALNYYQTRKTGAE
ncbi:MAG: NifB/NifX family molybdenum-iron cluster-binding protein [Limnospira sp.]